MAACSSSQGEGDTGDPQSIEEEQPVDVTALRTGFLAAVDTLATAYAAGVDASCTTGSNEALFDTMRGVMQKVMSEVLDMQTALGLMASGGSGWGGGWGAPPGGQGPVDQEAMKEAMRIILGDDPYDPACDEQKKPRIPVDAAALVSWIEQNLLADELIVAHDTESVTFRLDADTVCRLVIQGENGAPPDEERIELCMERARQADVRLVLRPGENEAVEGAVTTGGGAAHVLSLTVLPHGEITSDMDLSEAEVMLAEFGEQGQGQLPTGEMRGRLATYLGVQPDGSAAVEVSIVEALQIASSVPNAEGEVTGQMTLAVAPSSPFITSSTSRTDGCLRTAINAREVFITWTPEDEDAETGPLEMSLPAGSAELTSCGNPRDVRITGVYAGSETAYTRSGGETVCALDINGSRGITADILFDKRDDGILYATAIPELDFRLQCQPVPDALPAAINPLLRDYAFTLTEGEWMSLKPKSNFLTWLLELLLGL